MWVWFGVVDGEQDQRKQGGLFISSLLFRDVFGAKPTSDQVGDRQSKGYSNLTKEKAAIITRYTN